MAATLHYILLEVSNKNIGSDDNNNNKNNNDHPKNVLNFVGRLFD
jgi:hypothetical protein